MDYENQVVETARAIYARNVDLVDKFLAIAESKVSIIDAYGDENWEALPGEIKVCLKKIANREQRQDQGNKTAPMRLTAMANDAVHSLLNLGYRRKEVLEVVVAAERRLGAGAALDGLIREGLKALCGFVDAAAALNFGDGAPLTQILYAMLEDRFREYHSANLNHPVAITDTAGLSGVEFETYIARILAKLGYDVSGTSATGDQGADLIAEREGRKIIIQAKRYEGTVGNKAVQEVIAALSYYGGDEGWVVTSSTFTASAKALAQKANIKLFDGADLATINKLG
jgi:hypothetical protein